MIVDHNILDQIMLYMIMIYDSMKNVIEYHTIVYYIAIQKENRNVRYKKFKSYYIFDIINDIGTNNIR